MPLATLSANVIDNLTQGVREQTIVPLASGWVEGTIKRILVHGLRVDDIRDTLNPIEALESGEKDLPRVSLSAA